MLIIICHFLCLETKKVTKESSRKERSPPVPFGVFQFSFATTVVKISGTLMGLCIIRRCEERSNLRHFAGDGFRHCRCCHLLNGGVVLENGSIRVVEVAKHCMGVDKG
jgi:hypothetical protein